MKVLSLFDGMSCGRIALDQLGMPVEKYYASEIDKYAIQVSQANYPDIEQVGDICNLDQKEYLDVISKYMGVKPSMINSDRFVCQNRVRFYWTNIFISALPERPKWNKKYYQWRRTYFRENKSGVCPTLMANMGTGGHNVPLRSKNLKDKLSPLDCERLQTVPDNYTNHVSNCRRYQMLGNGWTIEVIKHIFKNMEI